MLADPVESDDEPVLLEALEDGVAVVVVVVDLDDVTDEVATLFAVVDVPASVCAAATPSAATAAVPSTPKLVVSLRRSRRARSRSTTVSRCFGAGITAPPADAPVAGATRRVQAAFRGGAAAPLGGR